VKRGMDSPYDFMKRLGLTELNPHRVNRHPTDKFIRRASRDKNRLKWALAEFDQLTYAHRFKLTPLVLKIRQACSSSRPNPKLP